MTKPEIKIFSDFDGTVTQTDVGEALFRKFADKEKTDKIIEDLLANKISAKECWVELCKIVEEADEDEWMKFPDTIEVTEGFTDFVNYCKSNRMELIILSDGFSFYIERIFAKEGLSGIKYFANRMIFTEDKKVKPLFPYEDPSCRTSANCKRNHIINNSSDDDFTVYIGDGNSDKYPVQFCDYIFAKKDLRKFCEKERISYSPFNDFNDIIKKLDELNNKKRLKKRHQAELKRREAYMTE